MVCCSSTESAVTMESPMIASGACCPRATRYHSKSVGVGSDQNLKFGFDVNHLVFEGGDEATPEQWIAHHQGRPCVREASYEALSHEQHDQEHRQG